MRLTCWWSTWQLFSTTCESATCFRGPPLRNKVQYSTLLNVCRHDSKYAKLNQTVWEDLNSRFFAEQVAMNRISEERAKLVCKICENVSYSKEVKRIREVSKVSSQSWHH